MIVTAGGGDSDYAGSPTATRRRWSALGGIDVRSTTIASPVDNRYPHLAAVINSCSPESERRVTPLATRSRMPAISHLSITCAYPNNGRQVSVASRQCNVDVHGRGFLP